MTDIMDTFFYRAGSQEEFQKLEKAMKNFSEAYYFRGRGSLIISMALAGGISIKPEKMSKIEWLYNAVENPQGRTIHSSPQSHLLDLEGTLYDIWFNPQD